MGERLVQHSEATQTVTISGECFLCGKPSTVEMPAEAYTKWTGGMLIQRAWPEASAGDRELAMTGSHDDCFNAEFEEEPEFEEAGVNQWASPPHVFTKEELGLADA